MRYQQPLAYVDAVARAGSIRKAANTLAISSTALNRRILSLEEDLGAPLFERVPGGVRLSAAGEVFVHFARNELAGAERMCAQVAELATERRGHIALACGSALMQVTLPRMITAYRRDYAKVSIAVSQCGRVGVAEKLENFDVDFALVLEPELSASIEILACAEQPLQLVCRHDHPLVKADGPVRLDNCFDYAMALPPLDHGVRHLLEERAEKLGRRLPVVLESESVLLMNRLLMHDWTISFAVPAGSLTEDGSESSLVTRDIDARDLRPGRLALLQLQGRTLPVAAARFADQLSETIRSK